MSNRFKPASAEELAARGLNPDGTPMKVEVPKAPAKKTAPKKSKGK